MELSIKKIAEILNGEVEGNESLVIQQFDKIEEAKPNSLTFLSNEKYETYIYNTQAAAVIVNADFVPKSKIKSTLIRVPDAYLAVAQLLEYYKNTESKQTYFVSKLSSVHPTAKIDEQVTIHDFCFIGENTVIGKNVVLNPQVYLGKNVRIGENTLIFAGVKVLDNCTIGRNCKIQSGTVIGSDGFGFAPQSDGSFVEIPQLGHVIIEDNVNIGANCTVDRATLGATIIREGVKLDNLVQIAHNVEIGENTVIAAQSGVAGSAKVGNGCMVGGQVAIIGHINVAANTKIGGKAGVNNSIKESGKSYSGYPAIELKNYLKSAVLFKKLPELMERVNQLEKNIQK